MHRVAAAGQPLYMNKLYDTIAFRRKLSDFPQWTDMLARHRKQNLFADGNLISPGVTWKTLKKQCAGLGLMGMMKRVNALWNRKRYVSDQRNFRVKDYWQTPDQFSRLGGDCEDYAIAKMLTLQELGVENPMRLLMVKRKGADHCVLAVDDGDRTWILDNVSDAIAEHRDYDCRLVASLGDEGAFSYVTGTAIA